MNTEKLTCNSILEQAEQLGKEAPIGEISGRIRVG